MAYTGGELNWLSERADVTATKNSVRVMDLCRKHRPKTELELEQLIEHHHIHRCSCGVRSKGTLKDFGRNLFAAQKKYWKEIRYTMEECQQWIYDLFVVNTMKGLRMEHRAMKTFRYGLPTLGFKWAEGELDSKYRIDILVLNEHKDIIGGVQVKPNSFNNTRKRVQEIQKSGIEKWGKPVEYLVYNKNTEEFINLEDIKVALAEWSNADGCNPESRGFESLRRL